MTTSIQDELNHHQTLLDSQPIVSVCNSASRIGYSIYDRVDCKLSLIADKVDPSNPFKSLDIILSQINPRIVLVSAVQGKVIDYIESRFECKVIDLSKKLTVTSSNIVFEENVLNIVTVINQWYSLQNAIKVLLDSEMVRCKKFEKEDERLFFLSTKVKLNLDVCAVRSINSIYLFLKNPAHYGMEMNCDIEDMDYSIATSMPILDVVYMNPGPIMTVDRYTYESLRIFDKISTINKSEQRSLNKITLLNLLNRCSSSQGRRHMRTILSWPLQGLQQINNRLDIVEYLMHPDQTLLKEQLEKNLKNIRPMAPLLTRLSYAIGTHRDFNTLYQVLYSIYEVYETIQPHMSSELEVFSTINEFYTGELRLLSESILKVVDIGESKRLQAIQVNFGVCDQVDEQKKLADSLEDYCNEVALEETEKYREQLGGLRCNVTYVPRLGFLNSVAYSGYDELRKLKELSNFEIIISTEDQVYFKTDRMNELDINAGDVVCDLIDKQEDVLLVLQEKILSYSENILKLIDSCGYLDCLMAFADVSLQFGYVRPQFELNGTIDIINGYHPLLSIVKKDFVSNDMIFFDSNMEQVSKIMLLTGPNSSGKTVYIKSTCLIVFMAHIGCFVPAEKACMPIVDAILTRLHPGHSISTGLSSFGVDLNQVGYALSHSTSKSLVAIDEFGKGTNPEDGFVLLKSLISYLARKNLECPYLLISTHYYRLLEQIFVGRNILSKTFAVTRDEQTGAIVYKYKLVEGSCMDSLADNVAKIARIPPNIIERARQIRSAILDQRKITAIQAPAA